MKKLTLIISTTLMIALVTGSAYAWGPKHRSMNDSGSRYCQRSGNQNAFNDLSKDQKEQLMALQQSFIDDTYESRSAQIEKRQQIRLLMQTSNPDRAKLTALHDDMDDLKKQIREKRIDLQLAAKKIAPDFNFGKDFKKGRRGMKKGGGSNCDQRSDNGFRDCYKK